MGPIDRFANTTLGKFGGLKKKGRGAGREAGKGGRWGWESSVVKYIVKNIFEHDCFILSVSKLLF